MAISTPPLDIGTYTDVGQIRARNEDSLQIYPEQHPAGQLFVVADGVGGENYGQEASQLAVRRIGELYYQLYEQYPQHPLDTLLREVLMRVNGEIYELALRFGSAGHMGTTAVVAVIRNTTLTVAWVGDSRIYVVSNAKRKARQITIDHSQVEDMVRAGQMSREDAERHPERNVLSRSLGGNPQVDVDSVTGELEQQDLIILCSDGLTRYVEKDLIAQHVLYHPSSQKAAEALGEMANNAGGKDNISIIVIHLGDRSAHNETMVQPDSNLPPSQVGNLAMVTKQNLNLARRSNRLAGNNLVIAGVIGGIIFVPLVMGVFAIMLNNGKNEAATQTAVALTEQAEQNSEAAIAETLQVENSQQAETQFAIETSTASAPTPTYTLTPSETLLPVREGETSTASVQQSIQTAEAVFANQTATVIALTPSSPTSSNYAVGQILYAQRDTQVLFSVDSPSGERLTRGASVIVTNHPTQGVHVFPFSGQNYYYVQLQNSGAGWVLADDLGLNNPIVLPLIPVVDVNTPLELTEESVNPPVADGFEIGQTVYIEASNAVTPGTVYLQTNAIFENFNIPITHNTPVVLENQTYTNQWWWYVRSVESGDVGWIEQVNLKREQN
jgi:PPM family protein phosphatase